MRGKRQGLLSAGQSHVGDSEVAIAHSSICFGCCHCSISLQHLESDFIWKQKPRPGVPLSHTNRLILTPKLQSRQSWVTQEDPNTPGAQGTGYSVQKRMPLACNSNPLVHKELPVTWFHPETHECPLGYSTLQANTGNMYQHRCVAQTGIAGT